MKKLSIIIPVYNAEDTIRDTIQSLLQTTDSEMEIIIVDDGSNDDSYRICQDIEKKHKIVKVFHQENRGVSEARNVGIRNAQSEWITFVDADDYVDCGLYLHMLQHCAKEIDLVMFGLRKKYVRGIPITCSEEGKEVKYSQKEFVAKMEQWMRKGLFDSCCNKIYRKNVITEQKLFFVPKVKNNEDLLFNLSYFSVMNGVVVDLSKSYWYYFREDSASNCYIANLINRYAMSYEAVKHFGDEQGILLEISNFLEEDLFDKIVYAFYQEIFKAKGKFILKREKAILLANGNTAQRCLANVRKVPLQNRMQRIILNMWEKQWYDGVIVLLFFRHLKDRIKRAVK